MNDGDVKSWRNMFTWNIVSYYTNLWRSLLCLVDNYWLSIIICITTLWLTKGDSKHFPILRQEERKSQENDGHKMEIQRLTRKLEFESNDHENGTFRYQKMTSKCSETDTQLSQKLSFQYVSPEFRSLSTRNEKALNRKKKKSTPLPSLIVNDDEDRLKPVKDSRKYINLKFKIDQRQTPSRMYCWNEFMVMTFRKELCNTILKIF